MADVTPGPFGSLGTMPDILPLFMKLAEKQRAAQVFGWGTRGVAGTFTQVTNHMLYQAHRPGASGLQTFPFDTAIVWANDSKAVCLYEDSLRYFGANIAAPFWFFDWAKLLLARLRAYQPSFDAPAEAKLVWTTMAAWAINGALSATNIHGTILPSALYEHVSGNSFENWAGDGSYMFTAQHGAVLADYWKRAWNDAAQRAKAANPGSVLLDSGFKVHDQTGAAKWESAWHGSVWPVPMETARFRYDPPIWKGNDCPVSGNCTPKVSGLAGATFNDGVPNDPYVVRGSNGEFEVASVGQHLNAHARFARFMPWLESAPNGAIDAARIAAGDPSGMALLAGAVTMSTAFGSSDAMFWQRLVEWKTPAHATPALIKTGHRAEVHYTTRIDTRVIPLFQPNHELSFRYFYPAMIDLILACDYHGLVVTGANTWWKYNVGSGMSGVGSVRPTENTVAYDSEGKLRRDSVGIPYVQPVAPPGAAQDAYTVYREAKERDAGLKFLVNWVGTLIALVQAAYGKYGPLVKQGKAWYDAYNTKFPAPEDAWRGVVPPTPMTMRQLHTFGMISANVPNSDATEYTVPDVGGSYAPSPTQALKGWGGKATIPMMHSVRSYGWLLKRCGLPYSVTRDDAIDLDSLRTPVISRNNNAPISLRVDDYPTPGTFRPGSQDVPSIEQLERAPTKTPAGLKILAFGLLAAVGGVLVTERATVKTRVSAAAGKLRKVVRRG